MAAAEKTQGARRDRPQAGRAEVSAAATPRRSRCSSARAALTAAAASAGTAGWARGVLALLAGRGRARRCARSTWCATRATWRRYARDFFPPDFRDWRLYLREMMVTLHIAIWGTVLAIVAAVPLGPAVRIQHRAGLGHQPVRRLMDACRAINEMVFAMLFIVAVGLGPFAGVLALCGAHHRHARQAVLRSGRGDRPAAGRRHPRDRRHRLVEIVYGVIPQVHAAVDVATRSTASNRTCARPRSSAWSAPAASAWCCSK